MAVSRSTEERTPAGGKFDPSTLGFPAYVSQTAGPNGQVFPRFDVADGFAGLGPEQIQTPSRRTRSRTTSQEAG